MKKAMRFITLILCLSSVAVFFQNCGQPGSISAVQPEFILETPLDNNEEQKPLEIVILPSNKFICEPFGNTGGADIKGGLRAELAYVDPQLNLASGVKNSYGSAEYFSDAAQFIKVKDPIFLSQINVPTRRFDQGFLLLNGTFLADSAGNKLIEWFALKMKSVLKLSTADEAGLYELATISDDGSRLFLGAADQEKEIINNDGAHSAKMKCASEALAMTKDSKVPMTYFYNQGPRTEIASVLIWRKKALGESANITPHRLCGISDSNKYWNPQNSVAGEHWNALLQDGWKIVDARNFELPDSQVNPCAAQNTNLIKTAQFSKLENGLATVVLDFQETANVKAKLYQVDGANLKLISSFDMLVLQNDKASLNLSSLEAGRTYAVEILIENILKKTQVLNEVRFQVK